MTKCPLCFAALGDEPNFSCVAPCRSIPDSTLSNWRGWETSSGLITIPMKPTTRAEQRSWPPKSVECRECGGKTTECCARCHFVFPRDWRGSETLCLAFAGARSTGKTVNIAVLVQGIRQFVTSLGYSGTFATPTSEETYVSNYQNYLYVKRGMPSGTVSGNTKDAHQREPIIIALGRFSGQATYLVIRDVAGEDLQPGQGGSHLGFFPDADLVLFLFDPLQVEDVRQELADVLPPQPHVKSDALSVLNSVFTLIGSGQPRLAVVLSKFDALLALGEGGTGSTWWRIMANPGAGFRRDPGVTRMGYSEHEAELVSEESRALLAALGAREILNAVENPHNGHRLQTRYFPISALGASPDDAGVNKRGIAPFRVLDPLRWLMAERNLLK